MTLPLLHTTHPLPRSRSGPGVTLHHSFALPWSPPDHSLSALVKDTTNTLQQTPHDSGPLSSLTCNMAAATYVKSQPQTPHSSTRPLTPWARCSGVPPWLHSTTSGNPPHPQHHTPRPKPRPAICSLFHLTTLLVPPHFHSPPSSSPVSSHPPSLTKVLPTTGFPPTVLLTDP